MSLDLLGGAHAPGFDDPLGMLRACHRRIEKQLATLERLQRHLPEHGHDDDARHAARAILRYFDTAAVNHHADEERSIFPRLARAAVTDAHAQAVMNELQREHRLLDVQWARLRPLLAGIAAGQRANLSPRDVLELREAYARHIAVEEDVLIPIAEATLDDQALLEIGEEMASRRDVDRARERVGS